MEKTEIDETTVNGGTSVASENSSALEQFADSLERDYTDREDDSSSAEPVKPAALEDSDEKSDEAEAKVTEDSDAENEDSDDDDGISFADLGLDETILAAIAKKGFIRKRRRSPSP